ncbi:unnamed protein product [Parascedosporium putredinis]|uniref:Tyrosine specific protein phosphatases domain-containing protein n=1 Tax=Parascedosporium putredinis TaxID=1442378 RepID=A0A9P1M9D8_9PEZI|nr:unnamed protein product [Parascedosporium putredinis]CAI7990618.1 unnamed protein product [Parascedosporium putredinis]
MDLNQQPMRIVPTFDGLDPGTLTEEDLQIITNNDAQIADDRSAMWTYKMRHEAQRILDFLYLGPRTIVKDAQWLNATGITMIVLAHDVGFGPLLKSFAEKCTEGLDIETLLIPVASSHGLTKLFDDITRAINRNLLSVYRQQAEGAGDSQGTMAINSSNVKRGKVLVTCQTGNDRATVIAAAYIMSVFGVGMVDAVNFITSQRFCSNFDEEAKRALCSWEEILGARKDVHRARTPVGSERGGSGAGLAGPPQALRPLLRWEEEAY